MAKQFRLLILEKARPEDPRISGGIARIRALNSISESGAKVRHDSGGRFVVIESSADEEKALKNRLAGARVVGVDEDVKSSMRDLDPTEQLFLDALKIRTSQSYRDAKRKRIPGDSPEEKDLASAPCIREEY